jgi:hypothetical protein
VYETYCPAKSVVEVAMRHAFKALIFSLLLLATPVWAHHSFSAQYDSTKPVKLTGKVTKVEWTNPHIYFYIDVADEKTGKLTNWALEMGSPNALMRLGWSRNSMQINDVVTVEASLAKDGSKLANVKTVVLTSNGKTLLAGSSEGNVP